MLQRRPQPTPPGPKQESVWDFPRPPRVELSPKLLEIHFAGVEIARTERAWRVCETASPPTFYVPPGDILTGVLQPGYGRSTCEWKGPANYQSVVVGSERAENAAWSYDEPWAGFEQIAKCVAFYPASVTCILAGKIVRPQEGGFYGGWVTDDIVGPWKGAPGTGHW